MALAELLELADDDDRERDGRPCRSATPRPTADPRCARRSPPTYDSLAAEDVMCFAGAEEGLYLAMQVLLDPGDHAVSVTPNYQAAETVPLAMCEVTGVALGPGTRLGTGHRRGGRGASARNPGRLGQLPEQPDRRGRSTRRTWRRLAELCDERGIHLFSDEVYRGLEHDPARTVPRRLPTCRPRRCR